MLLNINKPATVIVSFNGVPPRYFCLYDDKGRTYYFRYLDGKTPRIKFNMPDPGQYNSNHDFQVVKTMNIETPDHYPQLPPAERDRWKEPIFVYNPNLTGTPARIFTDTGVIEHSPDYYRYPPPVRLFLDLHEQGHFLYQTEEYCDLFALINYLRMGYNRSTAYYTLSQILSRSNDNLNRLKFLLTQITANGDQFNPGI